MPIVYYSGGTPGGGSIKKGTTGITPIGSGAGSVVVTFPVLFTGPNPISVVVTVDVPVGDPDIVAVVVGTPTLTGFTASLSANTPNANYVLNWNAVQT